MATALTRFWSVRGLTSEGREWVRSVLELDGLAPELRAKSLFAAGYLALDDDLDDAKALFDESLALARTVQDTRLEAAVLSQIAWILSAAAAPDGSGEDGAALARRSLDLARQVGDAVTASAALNVLGDAVSRVGDESGARALYEESLALRQALGDTRLCANSLFHLGELALRSGDRDIAIERYEEGLGARARDRRHVGERRSHSRSSRGCTCSPEPARTVSLSAPRRSQSQGREEEGAFSSCLQQTGALLLARGNATAAVRLWGAAEAQLRRIGSSPSRLEELIQAQFGRPHRPWPGSVRSRAGRGYGDGAGRGGRARDGSDA